MSAGCIFAVASMVVAAEDKFERADKAGCMSA
jgi:hypothetical protein